MKTSMATLICTLKRCQGRRGCICPTGRVPIGTFAGRKLEPIAHTPIIESDESAPSESEVNPTQIKASPKKLVPLNAKRSPMKSKPNSIDLSAASPAGTTLPPLPLNQSSVLVAVKPDGPDGHVVVRYNHYKKPFQVLKGTTTAALIDAEYFLSFAFPKSKIHLTLYGPSDFSFEELGHASRPWLEENPPGTYHDIDIFKEYWVDIEEDEDERRAYEERQDTLALENAARRSKEDAAGGGEDNCSLIKTTTESCSCIEGNPCLDRYACKDWENRYDVAKRCGWKGFQ